MVRHFPFENDLILSPVYKRALFATLCAIQVQDKHPTSPASQSIQDDQRLSGECSHYEVNEESVCEIGLASQNPPFGETLNLTPENVAKVVREIGGFSAGVKLDLARVKQAIDPYALSEVSLPLGSIIKQHQMLPEERAFVNAKLI